MSPNKNSPRKDKNGRDLYRVKLTDGMNFKTVYIFAYSVDAAIEKAKGEGSLPKWLSCGKVS